MSNFITEIKIEKVRHLENINIVLGEEKKHLILTGKNGSGKTSVLEELDRYISMILTTDAMGAIDTLWTGIENRKKKIEEKVGIAIILNKHDLFEISRDSRMNNNQPYNFIYSFFPATRINETNKPKGVTKVELSNNKIKKLNQDFMQYIVNLKTKQAYAQLDGDSKVADKINNWFAHFEKILQTIFNDNELKIVYDRDNFNFTIQRPSREEFDFNTLSAGYSAIVDIITELILKIETTISKSFDVEGIVLIDEIENHLHVELQKNILPLLTSFFPNIQFIVTTHSPFILQSIENSIVYDLERREQLSGEKLSKASYTDIVKNYFEVDSQFSQILENEVSRYENLVEIFDEEKLNREQEKELLELDIKLDKIAPMLSDTIYLRFKEAQDRISEDG